MYCQKCGIHNTDDAKQCQICGIEITGEEKQEDIKIFTDLTRYPFRAILYISLKTISLPLIFIMLPLIAIFYFLRKMTERPFLSLYLNSKTPKFHRADIDQFHRLHRRSFEKVSSYLARHGFEPLIDLEDVSMVQGNLQRLFMNRHHKIYSTIHINKATGKVTYVTFSAVTPNKTYLLVDNAYSIPFQYPENLIVRHFPGQSVRKIYRELLQLLDEFHEEPQALELEYFLPIGYNIRKFWIEQGLQQGILYIKEKGTPGVTVCYHHPTNAAVRLCSVCNTSLCEACYTLYQDYYYCDNCLPEEARTPARQKLPTESKYAGLGVRALANLIDLVVIALGAIAVYFGSRSGIRMLPIEEGYGAFPFILTQLFLITFTVFYLIVPIRKYGRTIGKKMWGLRVVDHHGNIPDTVAAIVRFAYHLVACLFVFPLLGYLFIPFRRTKQGLHDQLAGTFVVTKHPQRKALLSWCLLLVICGIVSWYTYQSVVPWFSYFFGSYDFATEITLKPEWVRQFDNENPLIFPYVIRGEQYILSTRNSLEALDMRTGSLLWKKDNFHNATIQTRSKDPQIPLIIIQYQENGTSALLNVDPESGAIIWEQALESSGSFVTIDAQAILVYDNTRVRAYNRKGTFLWEKRFQDSFMNEYAILNKHVLLGRYSESKTAQTLMYLERQTGEVLWEIEKSPYHLGHVLGEGYQVFYTDEGKTVLMYLPEQKLLWELSQDIGHVMAYDETQSYLYTTTSTVRVKDGANVFSYPSNAHFTGQVTDDFLILLHTNHKSEMFLIDKVTGDVTTSFQEKTWSVVVYLTEDESQLYLAAQNRPTDPKNIEILSELLLIDKKTFTLREIPVGKNIGALQFKIFPRENLVFIPTYHQVGGYRIED